MLLVTLDGTGQTRMVGMGAPDTSDIDLDPANFKDRADLVTCLEQLYIKIGCPSYRDLQKIGQSRGIELSTSTIGDLIGENSKTNPSKLTWKTVELFVRACGVPETELDRWRAAWEAAMTPDRPAWQKERQHLLATIDQLTAALEAAEARTSQLTTDLAEAKDQVDQLTADLAAAEACTEQLAAAKERIEQLTAAVEAAEANAKGAEAALAAYHQSAALCLPEPLEQLRRKADIHRKTHDYAAAVNLYRQIARQVKREHGPDDPRTLQAQHRLLEVETETLKSRRGVRFRVFARHTLNARWQKLIGEHRRLLPEGSRMTLELRLDHIYWVAILLRRRNKTTCVPFAVPSPLEDSATTSSLGRLYPRYDGLSPARKLLIGLYADCENHLSPDDPFTAEVFEYMHTEDLKFKRPERQRRETKLRLEQQIRNTVFQYRDATT
jgi:hypothetical protein